MSETLYERLYKTLCEVTDDTPIEDIAKACERVANQEIKDLLENLSKEFDGCGLEIVGKLLKSRVQELEKKLS